MLCKLFVESKQEIAKPLIAKIAGNDIIVS